MTESARPLSCGRFFRKWMHRPRREAPVRLFDSLEPQVHGTMRERRMTLLALTDGLEGWPLRAGRR